MSPLVRKEIRLILPFWGIALALAIVPAWILVNEVFLWRINEVVLWLLGFGLLLLGLAPFGQEFGLGTFSLMLAQPCERGRIWKTKILLIAAAAALVFLAFVVTLHVRVDLNIARGAQRIIEEHQALFPHGSVTELQLDNEKHYIEAFWGAAKVGLLLLIAAITGGLWATLLFRQTGAAMWFAVLIPGALIVIVEAVFHNLAPPAEHIVLSTVLVLYSIAGLIWAQRMFASAQDSQWLGETVAMLSLSPAKKKVEDTAAPRRKGAFWALVRKEIQSHQISFLVGFGLLVLHFCTLVFRRFETLPKNSELLFVVEAVPFLWLLVPWLIGSVAVAEERKLGTMESQLCLPVTRRFQFVIKLGVVLLLGFVLGAIMPVLLETLGSWFHISSNVVGLSVTPHVSYVEENRLAVSEYRGIIGMCLGAIFIAAASFFASTLCRNSLHALGGGMVWGCAFFFLGLWVMSELNDYGYSIWKGPLIFFTGLPVAIIVVVWLSFSNYKRLHAGRNVWLRNVLTLSASLAFVGIATAFVYQRPWELAMTLETHHGAPRLSGPIEPKVCMPNGRMFALLPDGRLWTGADYREKVFDRDVEVWDEKGQSNRVEKLRMHLPTTGTFIGGSNWVALAANRMSIDVVALQSDGTLWNVLSRGGRTNRVEWFSLAPQVRPIGVDSDWKCVAASERYFLAVKKDGTLWGWGNNDGRFAPDTRERIPEPVRVGTDSDWSMVFGRYSDPLLMKTDGTIFEWIQASHEGRYRYELIRSSLNGKDWLAVAGSPERDFVIRRDGTLWGRGYLPSVFFGSRHSGELRRVGFTRIGDRSDWAWISGSYWSVVAIRKDGSLVKNETEWFSSTFGQPSRYSDWLAADMDWNGILALASDGTLSWWGDTRYREGFLLAPTHQPLWSQNIFSGSSN